MKNPTELSDKELVVELIGHRAAKKFHTKSLAALLSESGNTTYDLRRVFAAQEFMQRVLREELKRGESIRRPHMVFDYLKIILAGKEREVFVALYLDNKHRLIVAEELSRGTIGQATVYPREAVKCALKHNAAAVIVAHNHPSGVVEPSTNDMVITRRLKDAFSLVGVTVLDHVIVAGNECLSFVERGFI